MLIVNGPVARKLGINSGDNVFGPGNRANATIGRAARLIMLNALNTRPGALDRSTLGNGNKYTCCIAENEADSPWEPLHVERGMRAEESAVTVFAAEAQIQVYNQLSTDPEQLCMTMADAMANLGSANIMGQSQMAVVWAGEHVETFRKAKWTRAQIKQTLYNHARRSHRDIKRAGRMPGPVQPGDENIWRHTVRTPDDLIVVHAGGKAGSFSAVFPGWGNIQASRSVTIPIAVP
jgi:hypothetical protein